MIYIENGGQNMLIVGQVSTKEEAEEITFIAKMFIVGQRARFLAKQIYQISENSDKTSFNSDYFKRYFSNKK